jgi:hypothetical protein
MFFLKDKPDDGPKDLRIERLRPWLRLTTFLGVVLALAVTIATWHYPLLGIVTYHVLRGWPLASQAARLLKERAAAFQHNNLDTYLPDTHFSSKCYLFSDYNSSLPRLFRGPRLSFAINAMISTSKSVAAIHVTSATVSYGGLTSTTSAPTRLIPSRPLMNLFTSLVVQPPDSGVPVAGAILGSSTDMMFSSHR